ncbi:MAG: indolepyruvate oxidoreductase subunit beta [Candidatus Riflebacteria bacterium]|nr:indolepyruvate oxidoreductase subunit beta [Candidatus Riflebacteria bacterium]
MDDTNISVVISGVGGQGVILASDLIAEVGLAHGLDVKKAEVHGMAQRGGSVISHIRLGPTVHSPMVSRRSAHVLCALEPLEAIRYVEYVRADGAIFYNSHRHVPLTAIFGTVPYPEDPGAVLGRYASRVVEVEALRIALELEVPEAVNVVMLGAISSTLPFTRDEWMAAIEKKVKARFVEVNKVAFRKGLAVEGGSAPTAHEPPSTV